MNSRSLYLFPLFFLFALGSIIQTENVSNHSQPIMLEYCAFSQNASTDLPWLWHGIPFAPDPPLPPNVCPDSYNSKACCNNFQVTSFLKFLKI